MAHWDGNVYGVSVDPVLSGCVVYMGVESSTRLGGFRALKKTPEAPYTTKVNYRKPTSRGTTRHLEHLERCQCCHFGRVLAASRCT